MPKRFLQSAEMIQNLAYIDFFFDSLFAVKDAFPENVCTSDTRKILQEYCKIYDCQDDSQQWFERIKQLAESMQYAPKPKDYKQNPQMYKGHVGDISMVLRIAVTGKTMSPDLYSVMQILGKQRVIKRLMDALERIKE